MAATGEFEQQPMDDDEFAAVGPIPISKLEVCPWMMGLMLGKWDIRWRHQEVHRGRIQYR